MQEPPNLVRAKAPKPAHVQQGVMHGTPATRHLHALAVAPAGSSSPRRRRSGGKKKAASRPRSRASAPRVSAARSGKHRLVKGSAAAKAYMSKIRKLRGKKAKAA